MLPFRKHSSRLTEEKQRAAHQLEAAEQRYSESLNRAEQAAAARLSEQEQRLRALSSAAEQALAGGRESWKAVSAPPHVLSEASELLLLPGRNMPCYVCVC